MSSGTITLRRPRVRGVEERFESRVLPLFARRTKELGALLPELYLHGLAEGDFELAMRGLLGEGAPLSKSSIRRLRAGWTAEFEEWSQRRLEGREVVYVWADGIYVKAGLERDKAALLVVLGAMGDGTKEVLALRSGYRESVESWSEVSRDLKARGIEAPRLLMADGNAAIWGAVRQVWPEAGEQRCWNHKMRNVLDRLPQREQSEAKDLLRAVVSSCVDASSDPTHRAGPRLWGKDLTVELERVYRSGARYVVIFVSTEYVEKAWPNVERQHALAGRIQRMDNIPLSISFSNGSISVCSITYSCAPSVRRISTGGPTPSVSGKRSPARVSPVRCSRTLTMASHAFPSLFTMSIWSSTRRHCSSNRHLCSARS